MKRGVRFMSNLLLPLVIFSAFVNHLLTFMAYDWYDGIDGYSYDVCGLQLASAEKFDLFPIFFRPPLIPILKNILYLLFEGHPYSLIILIHILGMAMAVLAYYLGNKFHKVVGFAMGMLVALNLPMSVNFHHISTFTFFVPLLLLAAVSFINWIKNPNWRALTSLSLITSLCFLVRLETLILIPVFAFFGALAQRRIKPAVMFVMICLTIYNLTGFFYYKNFGYWGINYNKGWSLFTRVFRAKDKQFDINNGMASRKVQEYLSKEWPSRIKDIDFYRYQMFAFNLAQQEIGLLEADNLFWDASLEAIRANPLKFTKFTLLRVLGQLDLYFYPGLKHKEFLGGAMETDSGHMWGFDENRMIENKKRFKHWQPIISTLESPLKWERSLLKAKLLRFLGAKATMPPHPKSFQMMQIVRLNPSGRIEWLVCGDSNMSERLWYCRDLDVFFFLAYWGQKEWSRAALNVLKFWDALLMPKEKVRINLHRIFWTFWISGIFTIRPRWRSLSLLAFLSIVVFYAFCQAIFSDNFGGRFELYMRPFLWLGASCGVLASIERWREKFKRKELAD